MPALTAPVTFGPDATGKKQPDGGFLERGGPIEPYWKEADRLGEDEEEPWRGEQSEDDWIEDVEDGQSGGKDYLKVEGHSDMDEEDHLLQGRSKRRAGSESKCPARPGKAFWPFWLCGSLAVFTAPFIVGQIVSSGLVGRSHLDMLPMKPDHQDVQQALGNWMSVLPSGEASARAAQRFPEILEGMDPNGICRVTFGTFNLILETKWGTFDASHYQGPTIPVLCRVVTAKAGEPKPTDGKVALLTAVDKISYLLRDDMLAWRSLMNRQAYAERTGRASFLYIGNLPPEMAPAESWCGKRRPLSKRFVKPIAALALMYHHQVSSVMIMDAGAWFSDTAAAMPESYLSLAPWAEIFFTAGKWHLTSPVLMDGSWHLVKNTPRGRGFIEAWWESRCGDFDVGALWLAMFTDWSTSLGHHFNLTKWTSYQVAGRYMYRYIRASYKTMVDATRQWSCAGDRCWDKKGRLTEPLNIGAAVILPECPVIWNHVELPAVRHDLQNSRNTFVCRVGPSVVDDNGCTGKAVCEHRRCEQ